MATVRAALCRAVFPVPWHDICALGPRCAAEAVTALLAGGADMGLRLDTFGVGPLGIAAERGHSKVVRADRKARANRVHHSPLLKCGQSSNMMALVTSDCGSRLSADWQTT